MSEKEEKEKHKFRAYLQFTTLCFNQKWIVWAKLKVVTKFCSHLIISWIKAQIQWTLTLRIFFHICTWTFNLYFSFFFSFFYFIIIYISCPQHLIRTKIIQSFVNNVIKLNNRIDARNAFFRSFYHCTNRNAKSKGALPAFE